MKAPLFLVLFALLPCVGLGGDQTKQSARYSVCGSVTDTAGHPFPAVFVHLYGPEESKRNVSSSAYIPAKPDADGHFKYDGYVPAGTYWVAVCPRPKGETLGCTKRLKRIIVGRTQSASRGCDVSLKLVADANGLVVER
jgi:hypothetical protein